MLKIPKYPNLTELAYLHIKRSILEGALGEGTRLTEENLAAQLGISKSPVREALNRLESDGLVTIEPRRGAYVRKLTLQEACELYELREVLEVHAVGLAKITPEFLYELAANIDRMKSGLAKRNTIAYVEEDIRFHNLIAAASGNQELRRVLENISQKTALFRSRTYRLVATTSPDCHDKIYEALNEGDRDLAQRAMREHILFFRDTLLKALEAEEASAMAKEEADLATAGPT